MTPEITQLQKQISDLAAKVRSLSNSLNHHAHRGNKDLTNPIQASDIAGLTLAYAGQVASDASSNVLPAGWSASYNGTTKAYTITHNLGTTKYQPIFYVGSFALWGIIQGTPTSTSFSVDFENSSGSTFATAWGFVLGIIS